MYRYFLVVISVLCLSGCTGLEGEWKIDSYKTKECTEGPKGRKVCKVVRSFPGKYKGCPTDIIGKLKFTKSKMRGHIILVRKCGKHRFFKAFPFEEKTYKAFREKNGNYILQVKGLWGDEDGFMEAKLVEPWFEHDKLTIIKRSGKDAVIIKLSRI